LRSRAKGPYGFSLALRFDGAEGDPPPVWRLKQRALHGDRLAQAVGDNAQTVHTHLVEALQHLVGNAGRDDSLLERIAVDEHRRLQRLEAGHSHGVEDPCSHPAKIGLTPGYGTHDLLLGIVGVVGIGVGQLNT
jgi:hypothetical protein